MNPRDRFVSGICFDIVRELTVAHQLSELPKCCACESGACDRIATHVRGSVISCNVHRDRTRDPVVFVARDVLEMFDERLGRKHTTSDLQVFEVEWLRHIDDDIEVGRHF